MPGDGSTERVVLSTSPKAPGTHTGTEYRLPLRPIAVSPTTEHFRNLEIRRQRPPVLRGRGCGVNGRQSVLSSKECVWTPDVPLPDTGPAPGAAPVKSAPPLTFRCKHKIITFLIGNSGGVMAGVGRVPPTMSAARKITSGQWGFSCPGGWGSSTVASAGSRLVTDRAGTRHGLSAFEMGKATALTFASSTTQHLVRTHPRRGDRSSRGRTRTSPCSRRRPGSY